jgi:hypothetical protein
MIPFSHEERGVGEPASNIKRFADKAEEKRFQLRPLMLDGAWGKSHEFYA